MKEITSRFCGKHKQDKTWVNDLSDQVGQIVNERFMIYEPPQVRKAKNNRWYINLMVGDKTGQTKLTIWQVPQDLKDQVAELFEVESVFTFEAQIKEFRGRTNLNVSFSENDERYWRCKFDNDPDVSEYQVEDYSQIPDDWHIQPVEEMIEYVMNTVHSFAHEGYRDLLLTLIGEGDWFERFATWPAAKRHHHSFRHGLIQHVYEMLRMTETIIAQYPNVNLDLLRTGIIVHDMGKMEEYFVGVQISANEDAFKLGHMTLGILTLDRLAREQGIEISIADLNAIYHLILSHHGEKKLGYGSAVDPVTPEAKIMHSLDMLSSDMNYAWLEEKRDSK